MSNATLVIVPAGSYNKTRRLLLPVIKETKTTFVLDVPGRGKVRFRKSDGRPSDPDLRRRCRYDAEICA